MKCPICHKELYEIGTVVQATQLFNIEVKQYSGVEEIEETIGYYCPECGADLPTEETEEYINNLLEEEE